MPNIEGLSTMLRRHALGTPKPLVVQPLPALVAVAILSFSGPSTLASAAEIAESRPDRILFTRIEQSQNLPGASVYDNVATEAAGTPPTARNGNKGQIDMFVLLFTFLSAVTLLMWRHTRRDDASPRRIGRRI